MKIAFKYFYLISFITMIFTISCKKEIEIPTGDGTFSCFIDGELFLPEDNHSSVFSQGKGLNISQGSEYFWIDASDYKKFVVYFMIVDYGEETYTLSDSDGHFQPIHPGLRKNNAIVQINSTRYLSKEGSGTVTITDTTGRELKGTFEFTLYNEYDDSDVIRVTDGRFDN